MTTYQDRANQTASEKILLCTIESAQICKIFTLHSGSVYKRTVDYFVTSVKQSSTLYVQATSSTLNAGEFYYNPVTNELFIRTTDSSNPNTKEIIVFYRHFFSNAPLNLPYDLLSGEVVEWQARINQTGTIKQSLDQQNTGIAIETSTSISFIGADGYFDNIIDKHIWENKDIKFYSWFTGLNISEKKKIFDGVIESKSFTPQSVSFKCKDFTFRLREFVDLSTFTSADGELNDSDLDTPKRRIYGRVNHVQCTGTDKILDGFPIAQTVTGNVGDSFITFSSSVYGTVFQEDNVIITLSDGSRESISIDSFSSSTVANVGTTLETSFSAASVLIDAPNGHKSKNRIWHIAGHKLFRPQVVISEVVSGRRFNIVQLDQDEILAGDTVSINGDYVKVTRVGTNSIVTATEISPTPSPGDIIYKEPINDVYFGPHELIIYRDFSLTNNPTDAFITLTQDAEFNIAPIKSVGINLTFTNGSRTVTNATTVDLRTLIKPRDYVRSTSISHTTWYQVAQVKEASLLLTTTFGGTTGAVSSEYKNIQYVIDDSLITVSCYGLERAGLWVKTPGDCVKDLLTIDALFTQINTASFTKANGQCDYTMSLVIPETLQSNTPTIRDTITKISESCFGSLFTDNDFNLSYSILNSSKPTSLQSIKDDDIISFSVNTDNSIIKKCIVKFAPFIDIFTGEGTFEQVDFTSDFVVNAVCDKRVLEKTCYLYHQSEANIIAQRAVFFRSLSNSSVTVNTKMNLALTVLNDQLYLDLDRLYLRYGGLDRKKIGIVSSISKNGTDCVIEFQDLGGIYNRVPSICGNSQAIFTSSTEDEKIRYGYIVDNNISLPDTSSEEMLGLNLIG